MKIWIDFDNTPHVNVLLPIIKRLEINNEIVMTARDVFETVPLLQHYGIHPLVFGNHKGRKKIKKVFGLLERVFRLANKLPQFDISFSLGGNTTGPVSRLRRKPSIIFSDNDISFKGFAYRFGTYFIFPNHFDSSKIGKKYGINGRNIYKFEGFKEDIYIADYKPDPNFIKKMPFDNFITIRPENLKASYVPRNSVTIVPKLFEKLKDFNVLFLPRYQEEKQYAKGFNNIFIPEKPLPGLDVCYYSKAILTGAGTFAREAAIIGRPAVSFFPGSKFLTVDEYMISKDMILKSRNIDEIYNYIVCAKNRKSDLNRCKKAQISFINIINEILDRN